MINSSVISKYHIQCNNRIHSDYNFITLNEITSLSNWKEESMLSYDEKKGRATAIDKIIDCMQSCRNDLNLSKLNLSSLPPYIPPHILTLNVSENEIENLHAVLLENLLELNASHNKIKKFPIIIPRNLTDLNLFDNCIDFLPDMNREMSSSLKLNVDLNPITDRNKYESYDARYNKFYIFNGPSFEIMAKKKPKTDIIYWIDFIFSKGISSDLLDQMLHSWVSITSQGKQDHNLHMLSLFLDYVFSSIYNERNILFHENIKNAIIEASVDEWFREGLFTIACGAMNNCRQEIYGGYYNLEMLLLESDVRKGKFDNEMLKLVCEIDKIILRIELNNILYMDDTFSPVFKREKTFILNKINVFNFILKEYLKEKHTTNTKEENEIIKENLINPGDLWGFITRQLKFEDIDKKTFISLPWITFVKRNYHDIYLMVEDNTQDENFGENLCNEIAKHAAIHELNNTKSKILGRESCMFTMITESPRVYWNKKY